MYDDNSYVSPEQLYKYKNKSPPYYLHMVVEYTKEHKQGLIKLDYVPPTPPDNSGPHNYIFQLYLTKDRKLNDNKIRIIEADKLKRRIHSEDHTHLEYLLVLLGLSTGDKPVESIQFKVNTNNNQPIAAINTSSQSPLTIPNIPINPLPIPEAPLQEDIKTININGGDQPIEQPEGEIVGEPNEVNDKVLDAQAEQDPNEEREKNIESDSNEDNDNDNEIDAEFKELENPLPETS